ncbi:PC-Esterase [Dillenia turbinata]|uniref:PC-Esterase n=1 Tax=Dillenia turbinata TaxID=194707 RepID=A0AAN8VZ23_9MAGN
MAKGSSLDSSTLASRRRLHFLLGIVVVIAIVIFSRTGKNEEPLSMQDATRFSSEPSCNLFEGKWVYDNEAYPLYKEKDCSFMAEELASMLQRLRNKRIVFVGDSLNKGQWISMICLIESSIPKELKSMQYDGSLFTFRASEYNASVQFYWAPLLVESNADNPMNYSLSERIVKVKAIEKHATHWTDADILVFNSYLWWRMPYMKVLWGSFESGADGIYKEVEVPRSYEMALNTWSNWLEFHINRTKTQLLWVSMSPTHEAGEDWGLPGGQNCYKETEPIMEEGFQGRGSRTDMMRAVEATIAELKGRGLNIQFLNITQLSEYRKDAHPAFYREFKPPLTQLQLSNPRLNADCYHWCLPGVPDTWNELLYAYILSFSNFNEQ